MLKHKTNYRCCRRIISIVILMSFWKIPVYGELPTTQTPNSEESGTRQYSEYEIETLIEDLTRAAHEAIEQAAAEAARAAALASLKREAAVLAEARNWEREYHEAKRRGITAAVVTGAVCFTGGLVTGLIIGGR
jgi:citrate synthase